MGDFENVAAALEEVHETLKAFDVRTILTTLAITQRSVLYAVIETGDLDLQKHLLGYTETVSTSMKHIESIISATEGATVN